MKSKYLALAKGVSENRFDAAIKKFQAALGADQVLTSADHLRPYTKVMMSVPDARHQPSAVVTATSAEQVQAGDASTPVVISADKAVKYESVVKVMDTLQRSGVQRVGLSVKSGGA